MMRMIRRGGFAGTVHAVNPNAREIEGYPCVPGLADLPAPPDLAVLSVRNERLEETLAAAIAARREGRRHLRFRRPAEAKAIRRSPRGSPEPREEAEHPGLRPELHGLLQRSRRGLDLRLSKPARTGARLDRLHRPFRQRLRRAGA